MDNDVKKCYNCNHLCRYYTKGEKQFDKTKYGWCEKNRTNEDIHNSCENFQLKKRVKRVSGLVKYYLHDLLVQVTQIRQIIEEQCDDEKL